MSEKQMQLVVFSSTFEDDLLGSLEFQRGSETESLFSDPDFLASVMKMTLGETAYVAARDLAERRLIESEVPVKIMADIRAVPRNIGAPESIVCRALKEEYMWRAMSCRSTIMLQRIYRVGAPYLGSSVFFRMDRLWPQGLAMRLSMAARYGEQDFCYIEAFGLFRRALAEHKAHPGDLAKIVEHMEVFPRRFIELLCVGLATGSGPDLLGWATYRRIIKILSSKPGIPVQEISYRSKAREWFVPSMRKWKVKYRILP